MNCPACGTANPDGSRFCNACGTQLDANAEAPLDPFLPRELLAKLEAARAGRAMEGERRVVTMLFCDVKGSTAMAETMDPEDWTEIMNGAFERLIAPVYRYEGTLARLMGDAIFAFFGAPIAHEDDPQRAVGASLDIISGIASYKEDVRTRHGLDLDVRVGIHTGPVMVGQVGSDLRLEYTAMGDAVNVAARMEQTAEPGTVQITAETHRLVGSLFDVAPRGAVEVKGKAEPVEAYTVLRRRHTHGANREIRDSPLIGRTRELDELTRAIEEAQAGRGRIVSIVGEAGLGKSRLVAEARATWDRRMPDAHDPEELHRGWETWQCVSYDATRPYSQYRRRVARVAGIDDTDPPEVVRTKLAGTMEHGWEDWRDPHARVWHSLFDVSAPGEETLEGEAFRDAITELVTSSMRAFGADGPRLLIFEDLHWCDEASMDILIETAKLVDEIPSLFLFAFRPDRQAPSWRLKQWLETEYPHRSTELTLTALSPDDSERLIEALIPDEAADVRAQILARTDGNPLFLEEVAAAVHEHHLDMAIPSTLQALFTARLDALDEEAKHTLQLASVIGRSFTEPVLGAVSGTDVTTPLRTLERAGLIVETARTPEREYAFRHSLTQDATYGTILLRRRRELHRRVAEVFEELYAARIEAAAALIAQHAREGGDDERTLRYATLAAEADARLYANVETVTHTTWAIEAAIRLGRTDMTHLYTTRGRALELSGRIVEAVSNYEEMDKVAEASEDRTAALAAALALTTLYATPTPVFDAVTGRELCERTVTLARELGDRAAESKALWNLMTLNVFSGGDPIEAVDAGERSLAIARELGSREQIAFTSNDLWRPYAAAGDLSAARAALEEARPLWQELENLPMYCENLSSTGALLALAGENAESLALTDESHRIAQEIGNQWGQSYSLLNSYHVDASQGNIGRALAKMRECIECADASGFMIPLAATRADMGALLANLGEVARGAELAAEGLAIAEQVSSLAVPLVMASVAEVELLAGRLDEARIAVEGSISERLPGVLAFSAAANARIQRGRLAAIRGDHEEAVDVADQVLAWLRPLQVQPFNPAALLLKGRSLVALGRAEEAEPALLEARDEAERLGFAPVLWQIDMALGGIAAEAGDAARANELREEAGVIVERLASSIDDADLRTSFLALPAVAAVTAGGTRAP
jgi:class 3 adenylate cyclase/tetratricopeptide (TPR) repeat protein